MLGGLLLLIAQVAGFKGHDAGAAAKDGIIDGEEIVLVRSCIASLWWLWWCLVWPVFQRVYINDPHVWDGTGRQWP
jgi:hypothetical protein